MLKKGRGKMLVIRVLRLMPDDYTRQGESSRSLSVNKTYFHTKKFSKEVLLSGNQ